MSGLTCGIFDWLDDARRGLAETWEERLRMLEYADRAGFFAYHLAEHHGTPLSTAPSPNLFFTLLAKRTTRLRFGPMVYLLPMYHLVRLIEEICLLDQLSGGRLELGVGRPASPHEAALYGVEMAEARAAAHEAIAVITSVLASGEINFDGKYYRLKDVKLVLRPVQRPYPPLWYPTFQRRLDSLDRRARLQHAAPVAVRLAGPARRAGPRVPERAGRARRPSGPVQRPRRAATLWLRYPDLRRGHRGGGAPRGRDGARRLLRELQLPVGGAR